MTWNEERRKKQADRMRELMTTDHKQRVHEARRSQGWNKIVVPDEDVKLIMALVDERAKLRARLSELQHVRRRALAEIEAERQRVIAQMNNLTNKRIAEKFEYTARQIDNVVNSARGANVR